MIKIEDGQKVGCQYWFSYLNQKAKDEPMPEGCVECGKVVECMFNQHYSAGMRVLETKKKELSEVKSHFLPKIFGFGG